MGAGPVSGGTEAGPVGGSGRLLVGLDTQVGEGVCVGPSKGGGWIGAPQGLSKGDGVGGVSDCIGVGVKVGTGPISDGNGVGSAAVEGGADVVSVGVQVGGEDEGVGNPLRGGG